MIVIVNIVNQVECEENIWLWVVNSYNYNLTTALTTIVEEALQSEIYFHSRPATCVCVLCRSGFMQIELYFCWHSRYPRPSIMRIVERKRGKRGTSPQVQGHVHFAGLVCREKECHCGMRESWEQNTGFRLGLNYCRFTVRFPFHTTSGWYWYRLFYVNLSATKQQKP